MGKSLITILFFFYSLTCESKQIFISSLNGNDSDDGLSAGNAWATLGKLNSMFPTVTVVAGDVILFEKGGIFPGFINMTKSVNFASYGSGAKPVISGFITLTGWTLVGGNIWQCTPSVNLKKFCNVFTINGVPQAVGRTPNANIWYTYQSATSTQLSSTNISGVPSYVGAEVVIRKVAYVGERAVISSQSGGTLTYGSTPSIDPVVTIGSQGGNAGYGFFLQRFVGSLDQQGEWYYNPPPVNNMRMYSTVDPNTLTIKVSYVDTLVKMGATSNLSNVSFNDLQFEGASTSSILNKDGTNISITNCDFNNNTRGINFHATTNATIVGNTFTNTFNCGVFIYDAHTGGITINANTFTNSGQLFGMGIFATEGNLRAIYSLTDSVTPLNNFQNIIANKIISTGSSAIRFNGSNIMVKNNVIDTFCTLLDDGGGIYSFTSGAATTKVFYNRTIRSNFVSNSSGAPGGAPGGVASTQISAIYLDDLTQNVLVDSNHIWNINGTVKGHGLQSSNGVNIAFRDNTVYNCTYAVNINKKYYSKLNNVSIKKNILYQKTNIQNNFIHFGDLATPAPAMTIVQSISAFAMDSNWISNLKASGYVHYAENPHIGFTFQSLATWQSAYSHDLNSIQLTAFGVTYTGASTNYYTNPTDTPKVVPFLGDRKIDPKGNIYNNTATIPRWSSLILIDNGLANQPPTANAGVDKIITLPANNTSVIGSGSDVDGTINSYNWNKTSGPATFNIATPNAATTVISNLVAGTYIFELTVTDNNGATGTDQMQILINPAPNQPPTSNAGADQTKTLPINTATLAGSGTDVDGTIFAYHWIKLASSPSGGTISNANIANPNISGLVQGVYEYELTVTDNGGLIDKDTMKITVNPVPNQAPTSIPGANFSITLPVTNSTLNGSGTDPDGTISAYFWTFIGGPTTAAIASAATASTGISNMTLEGDYTFALRVTDNGGLTDTKVIVVTVLPATPPPNNPPVANAGVDKTITLPTSNVIVIGTGTDSDGTITDTLWTQTSGPNTATIVTPTLGTTNITGLIQGVYTFNIRVTDDDGATNNSSMVVTVNAAPINQLPTANAGADQSITAPASTINLIGSGADPDGTISTYFWSQVSGTAATIANPNISATSVSGLTVGVRKFELTVTDNNGGIAKDTMQVTVVAANQPPVANAGANKTLTLPTNNTNLTGVASTDADGTINGYNWTFISGPNTPSFGTASAMTTTVTGLMAGTYVIRLTVTDNQGATGSTTVQILVNSVPNVAPSANAGVNKTITLPVNFVNLTGSGTDLDGTISSYSWVYVSGPSGSMIISPNSATTDITFTVVGTYSFRLTVTDNGGLTATDTVQVIVDPVLAKAVLLRGYRIVITP